MCQNCDPSVSEASEDLTVWANKKKLFIFSVFVLAHTCTLAPNTAVVVPTEGERLHSVTVNDHADSLTLVDRFMVHKSVNVTKMLLVSFLTCGLLTGCKDAYRERSKNSSCNGSCQEMHRRILLNVFDQIKMKNDSFGPVPPLFSSHHIY